MSKPKGRISINVERCKGCGLCVQACPHKVITQSEKLNAKGLYYVEATLPEQCTGCTNCALVCPDTVITVYQIKYKE